MPLTTFSPPGNEEDLSTRGRRAWSRDLSALLTAETIGRESDPTDSPRPQFFNPLNVEFDADAADKVIRWGAFPRKLARVPAPQRWELAEERDRQEEYCEWSGRVDRQGRLTHAFFTTEVPSYFHLLAADSPERLLKVYSEHVSNEVRLSDLVSPNGTYRERNRWNRVGAMHMIQPSNTLGAAVLLVAQATIVRGEPSRVVTNPNDLIRCGVNADIDRNSDPLIVGEINTLARAAASITFEDPVGLYLDSLQTSGWQTPDGTDPHEFWRIVRGDAEHPMRASFAVPAEAGYTISDITINGEPIRSPSQIAEFIQVKVVGTAHEFGKHRHAPRPCRPSVATGAGALETLQPDEEELPPLEDIMNTARRSR